MALLLQAFALALHKAKAHRVEVICTVLLPLGNVVEQGL
jgi:hypothetical protein